MSDDHADVEIAATMAEIDRLGRTFESEPDPSGGHLVRFFPRGGSPGDLDAFDVAGATYADALRAGLRRIEARPAAEGQAP